jgi:hypothetical protein
MLRSSDGCRASLAAGDSHGEIAARFYDRDFPCIDRRPHVS